MKKIISIAIVAFGLCAVMQAADTIRVAPLTTAVTNTVTLTAKADHITEPILFVSKTAATSGVTNQPVITVTPASGFGAYTVYTAASQSSNEVVVVNMNNQLPLAISSTTSGTNVLTVTSTASPRLVLMPGDVMTITGKANTWAGCSYYMQIKETKINP